MTDHLVSPHLAIDENLRTAMRFFGEATEAGEVVALPGSVAIYCGINYGVFNISLPALVGASV